MAELKKGDRAPSFRLPDQNEHIVRLSDYRGRHLLIYVYPKAGTPGCTKQACSVRDNLSKLTRMGVAAVGVSPDKSNAQKKFDQKHALGFPLLCDPQHATINAYGAWGRKSMHGKKYMGVVRCAFLIDPSGHIAGAWYKVNPIDTASKAMEALKQR